MAGQAQSTLEHARDGVRKAIGFGADLVLAIGGRVPLIPEGHCPWCGQPGAGYLELLEPEVPLERSMPVGVILTIPLQEAK